MPWKDKTPLPDQIKRRVAYLIAVRCRQQGIKNIAEKAGFNRDTVSAYADPNYGSKGGPQKFDIILAILSATGDDFAQVMYAAQNSTDEATFWAMMHCVLVAQQQLAIRATNEDRLAGGRLLPQALAVPRTRATDQVISHEPIYDEPQRLAM